MMILCLTEIYNFALPISPLRPALTRFDRTGRTFGHTDFS